MKYVNKKIFKIEIDDIPLNNVVDLLKKNQNLFIVTPNLDHHKKIYENYSMLKIYNYADLILNDSQFLYYFSKLFTNKLKNTVRGSDLSKTILEKTLKKNFLIFGNLIDIKKLSLLYPSHKFYQIEATFNKKKVKKDVINILNFYSKKKIDYLFLCGGTPYSEKIGYLLKKKKINSHILSIGNSVNFIIGKTKRAPKFISKIGLEWLFRAAVEPRLIYRYLSDLKFFYYILRNF